MAPQSAFKSLKKRFCNGLAAAVACSTSLVVAVSAPMSLRELADLPTSHFYFGLFGGGLKPQDAPTVVHLHHLPITSSLRKLIHAVDVSRQGADADIDGQYLTAAFDRLEIVGARTYPGSIQIAQPNYSGHAHYKVTVTFRAFDADHPEDSPSRVTDWKDVVLLDCDLSGCEIDDICFFENCDDRLTLRLEKLRGEQAAEPASE